MTALSELTTDELADGICLRAGQIAAAEAEQLMWIGEFDRREGWAGSGLLSCAHWLSWRIGLSLGTAREQVRVARRLGDLPELTAAFSDGRLSYSKVRAITRVAEADDGVDWVQHARNSTAAQLERIVRGLRRAHQNEAAAQDPEAAAWSVRTRVRYDDNGNFSLTITGPAQYLPVVQAGLDAKRAELQRQRDEQEQEQERAHEQEQAHEHEPILGAPSGVDPLVPPTATTQPPSACDDAAPSAPLMLTENGPASRASEASRTDLPDASAETQRDLEPAAGWPAGTTVHDVRLAMRSYFSAVEQLRDPAEHCSPEPMAKPGGSQDVSAEAPAAAAVRTATAVTDADALLALAQEALAAEQAAHPAIARRRRPQLQAQIDPRSGWARLSDGELLPPTSLRAVMRTLPGRGGILRLRPITAADLRRHDLGRRSRDVSAGLRELLGALDGECCRFPGCTRRKKLHAHHVTYWSEGGPTDLDNLVLVCSRHHTLIHAQGFSLTLHPDRRLDVSTAGGVAILHSPVRPWGDPAALADGTGRHVSAETLPPDRVESRMDLGYVVSVLMAQAA